MSTGLLFGVFAGYSSTVEIVQAEKIAAIYQRADARSTRRFQKQNVLVIFTHRRVSFWQALFVFKYQEK
jgi:hypothetical protein